MFIMKKFLIVFIFLSFGLALFAQSSSQKEWNKLSEDEKWLCLLTEPVFSFYDISRTTVNPEPQGTPVHAIEVVENDWGLYSKDDVLNRLANYRNGYWGGRNWWLEKAEELLKKYPDASIDEIAKAECLEIWHVVALWFYTENKELLGTHGTLALDIVRLLGIIRWSVSLGWFTEAEAVNEARPLMTQLLNAYDSWEDFAAHYGIGWIFYAYVLGYNSEGYENDVKEAVKIYTDASVSNKLFFSTSLKFPAKNQNNNRKLTFADVEYTPSEEAKKWYILCKALKYGEFYLPYEESHQYYDIVKEKAEIPCVALLKKYGRDFYNNNASKMLKNWRGEEDEKWLCLLTEPFLGAKNMSSETVNPEPKNKGRNSRKYLEDDWKLYSKRDILNLVERYQNGKWGTRQSFIEAKALYEKYPGYSLDEIARIECLGVGKIIDLYYYAENKDKIGEHGLLALDAVRILGVLRYGVAVGWLTEAEAIAAAKPLMTQLLDAYDSWEDFACHFALNWYYYIMRFDYDLPAYQKGLAAERKKYDVSAKNKKNSKATNSHDIKFPASNRNDSPVLTYDDIFYTPSEDAQMWCLIWKWDSGAKLSASEKEKLKAARKAKADIPGMAYLNILAWAKGTENISYISDYIKVIDKAEYKASLFHKAYIWYGMSFLLNLNNNSSEQADLLLSEMERLEKEKSWYYLNGLYNILRLCEMFLDNENFNLNNIDRIITDSENYAIEALDSFNKGKNEFPVTGDLEDAVSAMELVLKYYLFSLYSECTYMYYEARDLENAVFYMEQAEKNLESLKNGESNYFSIKDVKNDVKQQELKLKEVKAFIDSRYQENNDNRKMRPRDPKINAA